MSTVRWAQAAEKDLRRLTNFYGSETPYYLRLRSEIRRQCGLLVQFPQIGRKVPELEASTREYRELLIEHIRVVYEVRGTACKIWVVRSSRQRFSTRGRL